MTSQECAQVLSHTEMGKGKFYVSHIKNSIYVIYNMTGNFENLAVFVLKGHVKCANINQGFVAL